MYKYLSIILLALISFEANAREFLRWGQSASYVWTDKDGLKHFASKKPNDISDYKVIFTNYPVLSESKGKWKFISVVGKEEAQAAFSIKYEIKPSQHGKLVWYKFDYSDKKRTVTTDMFLAEINCQLNKITDVQQQTFDNDGMTRMTQIKNTRYSVPSTTDEDLIKFTCQKQ